MTILLLIANTVYLGAIAIAVITLLAILLGWTLIVVKTVGNDFIDPVPQITVALEIDPNPYDPQNPTIRAIAQGRYVRCEGCSRKSR